MILPDVNVLLYAYREDLPCHEEYRAWLSAVVHGEAAWGLSDLVSAGFLRIVTNRRVFDPPAPIEHALTFIETLRGAPNCVLVRPGSRHFAIFTRLCRAGGIKAGLVPDAWFAALAIESGCEWITTDRDFARFEGLRWRHPLTAR